MDLVGNKKDGFDVAGGHGAPRSHSGGRAVASLSQASRKRLGRADG